MCQNRATLPIAKPHSIAYSTSKSDTPGKLLCAAFDTFRRCDPGRPEHRPDHEAEVDRGRDRTA